MLTVGIVPEWLRLPPAIGRETRKLGEEGLPNLFRLSNSAKLSQRRGKIALRARTTCLRVTDGFDSILNIGLPPPNMAGPDRRRQA